MTKLFTFLGKKIERYPFRFLLGILVAFAIFLLLGIPQIELATGNDTLVQEDNHAYQSNKEMEEEFGGDAIIVLFKDETGEHLLSLENLEKMWNIEQKLHYEEGIYTIVSPASTVNHMTKMQSELIIEQIGTMSEGLETAGDQLVNISRELSSIEMANPELLKERFQNISQATGQFSQLRQGQDGLNQAGIQLEEGLNSTSAGISQIATQLEQVASQIGEQSQTTIQLNALAGNLSNISNNLSTMGQNTVKIQEGSSQTSRALSRMSETMEAEFSTIQNEMEKLQNIEPEMFNQMSSGLGQMGNQLIQMSEGLSIFVENSSMMEANFPTTQEALDKMLYEDENQTEMRPMFEQLLPDEEHTQMMIRLEGEDVISQSEVDSLIERVNNIIDEEEFETVLPTVSGRPVLDSSLRSEMQQNMVKMVVMAVVIMIVIMTVIFNVRWRLMPLITIFIAVMATIGLMSVLGVPITMVSMAVFPILIGLGINYSIQFQNRYAEDLSTSVTIKNVGKAVAVSVIATMLGFISLYISPVPMIQDFGAMLTIGVALALVSSLFILMPTLEIRDVFTSRPRDITEKEKEHKSSGGLDLSNFYITLAKFIIRFRIPVLIMAVGLGIAGFYVDNKVGVETNIETFMPQDMEALEDIRYVREVMGSADQLTLHLQDDKSVINPETLDWIDETVIELENSYPEIITSTQSINSILEVLPNSEKIETIEDFEEAIDNLAENQKKLLINEDNTQTLITLFITSLGTEELDAFISDLANDLEDAPIDVSITGPSVLDIELVEGLTSGRVQMTLLGLGLVYITLLIIYRSFIRPLATVLPVLIIVGISSGIMYLLGINFTPITSTLGALILGMGTEMNVMVLERYLEERYFGMEKHLAIQTATALIGRANLASALTTIGGFSVLMFSDFLILKDFGLMTVINVSLATLSTFIIMPALLFTMDKVLFNKKEKEILKTQELKFQE